MDRNKITVVNLLLFFLLVLPEPNALGQQHETCKVIFTNDEGKNISLVCQLADTPDKRHRGLMDREHLDHDRGMLFVYDNPSQLDFWMKNTKIPLSIAFIDADGYITAIREMQPNSLEVISSSQKVKYAVETNQGWFDKNSIKSGAKVRFVMP